MKFNMINKNKLQIIISEEDLKDRKIEKMDFTPYHPNAQQMLHDILEEAREACGFDVGNNAQLMIEAFPMTGKSMLITVTKLGEGAPFPSPGMEHIQEMGQALMQELMQEEEELPELDAAEGIFCFETLEDVIQAAHLLFDVHYDGDSQLLRYKNKYYLAIMEYEWLTDYGAGLLEEYSTPVVTSIAFFREHGEMVMEHNALEILSRL